jgi:hypothetical protein
MFAPLRNLAMTNRELSTKVRFRSKRPAAITEAARGPLC